MPNWSSNWLVSLPLILITVLIHVLCLVVIRNWVTDLLARIAGIHRFRFVFAWIMGGTVLLVTTLHAIEAAVWGSAYLMLGALPDAKSAMLYSLSAMTTYGHAAIYLEHQWQMMGAVEALNGIVLFGLTAAILFSVVESASKMEDRRRRDEQS